MTLAAVQQRFLASIVADATDGTTARDWIARVADPIDVYRHAYRTRLIDALGDTFAHTKRWLGDEGFAQVAAHHVIAHPPHSWTLDLFGEGFDATLAALFANDPDVAELAQLEWAMHQCFVAGNATPLPATFLATQQQTWTDQDWSSLRIGLTPSLSHFPVCTDCIALWRALQAESLPDQCPNLAMPRAALVWRAGWDPVFRYGDADEAMLLALAGEGQSFGALCAAAAEYCGDEAAGAQRAGTLLAQWLADDFIVTLAPDPR